MAQCVSKRLEQEELYVPFFEGCWFREGWREASLSYNYHAVLRDSIPLRVFYSTNLWMGF